MNNSTIAIVVVLLLAMFSVGFFSGYEVSENGTDNHLRKHCDIQVDGSAVCEPSTFEVKPGVK